MIQSITIKNFKSFREATLPLAPLTLLIGANASGKSNAIEGIQLLSWLASGRRLGDLLVAIREQEVSLRGTLNAFTLEGNEVTLGCAVRGLLFSITLQVDETSLRIVAERLERPGEDIPLYEVANPASAYGNELQVAYNNFKRGGRKPRITCTDQQAVFTQIATPARFAAAHKRSQALIPRAVNALRQHLESILFLDPHPRRMRGYSFIYEKKLQGDGASLSAVLYHLHQEGRAEEILTFIRSLPEQDIREISFQKTQRDEVMVELHETFGDHVVAREAALLSDGTLRVLAVAAALLSVPEGSMVVIEEIDNGVHPSRAELLLRNVQRVAQERRLRVLLTTHNPALLDAIPTEAIPDTVACYRDPQEGDSRLVRLEDLQSYPELVAQGPVGRLVTKGILDRFLKVDERLSGTEKTDKGLAWISEFRHRASSP
jgi:predicted ATPase